MTGVLLVVTAVACSTTRARQAADGGGGGGVSGRAAGGEKGGAPGSLGTGGVAAGGGGPALSGTGGGGGAGGLASSTGGAGGLAGAGAGGSGTAGAGAACASATCQADREWTQRPVAADAPPASVYVMTEKTVTDTVTGLVWQRIGGVAGARWNDANNYCGALTLEGQGGWRLPTLIELESLVDYSRSKPAIEPTAFPRTLAMDHWTSTMFYLPGDSGNWWTVRFATGATAWDFPTEAHAPVASGARARLPPGARRWRKHHRRVVSSRAPRRWSTRSRD